MPGRFYVVGGAVRDELLGRPASDRDWVVVGATPNELVAAGYRAVGRDFPVFLHPQTNEEVALARTERKSAPGYHGFQFHAAPEVTHSNHGVSAPALPRKIPCFRCSAG